MGNENRNLRVHGYSYNPTGNRAIDEILEAVVDASSACHNSADWGDEDYCNNDERLIDDIQSAANDAAKMKLFICTDHDSHYVPGASVVIAESEDDARALLSKELSDHHLDGGKLFTLQEIDASIAGAHILRDGDY